MRSSFSQCIPSIPIVIRTAAAKKMTTTAMFSATDIIRPDMSDLEKLRTGPIAPRIVCPVIRAGEPSTFESTGTVAKLSLHYSQRQVRTATRESSVGLAKNGIGNLHRPIIGR